MAMVAGEMKIIVQEARFERSTNTFFDMNPKYTINWKDQLEESGSAEGGDKCPKWNRTFIFDVGTSLDSAGVMTFTFLEDSTLIADCEIDVERLARHDEDDGIFIPRYLRLQRPNGTSVLPVFWNENYVTLLSGEPRTLNVSYKPAKSPLVEVPRGICKSLQQRRAHHAVYAFRPGVY